MVRHNKVENFTITSQPYCSLQSANYILKTIIDTLTETNSQGGPRTGDIV